MWSNWVKRSYLLKCKSFWDIKIPRDFSWNWGKLLKLRNNARKGLRMWLEMVRTLICGSMCGTLLVLCLTEKLEKLWDMRCIPLGYKSHWCYIYNDWLVLGFSSFGSTFTSTRNSTWLDRGKENVIGQKCSGIIFVG